MKADRPNPFVVRLLIATLLCALSASPAPAMDLDLKGSLGEAGFTHYVSPVSNPLFNETPYITTEIRPMWLHQKMPSHITVGGAHVGLGGDIDVLAVQIRVAITERLGFIATKDGWADVNFDHTLRDENGAANLAFGFKYAAVAIPESNTLVTVALRYEAPSGSIKTDGVRMQGHGGGFFDLFVAAGRTFGPVGLEANLGTQLAVETDHDASFLHYALHADYDVIGRFYPMIELNGYTPIDDAKRTRLGVGGMDLVNLGSINSDTIITVAPGFRVRMLDNVDFGFAYEVPVTQEEDLMDWRVTTDFLFHL